MISSYFANLYDTHKLKTKYNYFVESHGKNICDDHFSMVSNIVERYEKGKGKIKDIVELNKILETDFEKFRTGNIQNEVDLSPIQHQKERTIDDLLTRVLLLKSQLSLQKKTILNQCMN